MINKSAVEEAIHKLSDEYEKSLAISNDNTGRRGTRRRAFAAGCYAMSEHLLTEATKKAECSTCHGQYSVINPEFFCGDCNNGEWHGIQISDLESIIEGK